MRRRLREGRAGRTPPRPWPGQHFLRDQAVTAWMVRRSRLAASDVVWDIGAGDGALCVPLAHMAGHVVAVESDGSLVERLRARVAMLSNVSVVHRDFLTLRLPDQDFIVVANLPFAITTAVLRRLLDPRALMVRAVLLIEAGAATRFARSPSADPDVIAWHTWFDITCERHVPRSAFVPPPGVDGAVLSIVRRPPSALNPKWVESYGAFLRHTLQHPERPLRDALRGALTPEQMTRALRALGVQREAPAATLTPLMWGFLYLTMRERADPSRWPRVRTGHHRGQTASRARRNF